MSSHNFTDPDTWHEVANLFPLLSHSELQELADDIKANGLLNPVVLLDGKVLDGRNRALACERAGIEPSCVEWDANGLCGQSPVSWVISQNVMRRDLTKSQKAVIAVEALPLLAKEAKRNQSQAGKMFGNGKNIAFDKTDNTYRPPLHARKELARRFNVSEGYINHAQHIKEQNPSRLETIKSGAENISGVIYRMEQERKSPSPITLSSTVEWYTPEKYIKAARTVLGKFDLDPASCEFANTTVKADVFYTKERDGLEQPWQGNVWMNPPYADIGPSFVSKLLREHEAGRVTQAIVLLSSNSTDAKWFKPLFDHTICFADHRVKFTTPDGVGSRPQNGSVFVYLGKNVALFTEHFRQFGSVVRQLPTPVSLSVAA